MDFARHKNEIKSEREKVQEEIDQIRSTAEKRYMYKSTYKSTTIQLSQDQAKKALQQTYPKIIEDFFGPDSDIGPVTKEDCEEKLYEIKDLLRKMEKEGTAPYTWKRFQSFFRDFYGSKPVFPVSIKDLYRWQDLDIEETKVSLMRKQIYSFEGLQPDIHKLNLGGNLLTTIGPNAFPNSLCSLTLSFNPITSFDMNAFGNLSHLKSLLLVGLGLKTIPKIQHLHALTELLLCHNEITTVKEGSLPKELENLSLGNNKITTLNRNIFVTLTRLKELDLCYNHLVSFNSMLPKSLTKLNLSTNRDLETIDLTIFKQRSEKYPPWLRISLSSTKVKRVELAKNNLKSVDFFN